MRQMTHHYETINCKLSPEGKTQGTCKEPSSWKHKNPLQEISTEVSIPIKKEMNFVDFPLPSLQNKPVLKSNGVGGEAWKCSLFVWVLIFEE
jgi:hypothetical protein